MAPMELQKILVGTDVSESADTAISEAVAIARHTGAHVILAYATTHREPRDGEASSILGSSRSYEELVRERLDAARAELVAHRDRVRQQGVYACYEIIESFPDTGLIEAAERIGADLIVVGTHGYTGFKRLLMGSVAERVVRGATTSVMVARERDRSGAFHRLLVPTDFSPAAERALQMALVLAAPGGAIDLHHVWQVPPPAIPYAAPVSLGPAYAELRDEVAGSVEEHGQQLVRRYANAPATVRFAHSEDTPVHGIQRAIDDGEYECVVMGSHGRRGIRRWLLGSVAEQTVRYAPCSVVVVRGAEDD